MDKKVFNDISYGMYTVTTNYNDKNVGCFINTLTQITSENPIVSISLNKENYTNEAIKNTKRFTVSILSIDTNKDVISKFGYFSSKDIDKFDGINYETVSNLPVVLDNICSYIICEVINIIDAETHDIFLARVIETKKISDKEPMTYKYYHEVLKGKAPKKAPTYIEEEKTSTSIKYRCIICGHIYDEEKEGIKFEDLPDDWKCPICGVSKDKFERI